jgi:hypothetical protein
MRRMTARTTRSNLGMGADRPSAFEADPFGVRERRQHDRVSARDGTLGVTVPAAVGRERWAGRSRG